MGQHAHDGICRRYRGPRPRDHRQHPDEYIAIVANRRWCSACERNLQYKGLYCPCCEHPTPTWNQKPTGQIPPPGGPQDHRHTRRPAAKVRHPHTLGGHRAKRRHSRSTSAKRLTVCADQHTAHMLICVGACNRHTPSLPIRAQTTPPFARPASHTCTPSGRTACETVSGVDRRVEA